MAKYSQEIVDKIVDLVSSDSYTVEEICGIVGIVKDTYYRWLSDDSDFSDAIKKAKNKFDELCVAEAKKSLVKKIRGYTVDEIKTKYIDDNEGKPKIVEQIKIKKHVHPDTASIIFLLTNKAGDEFKNRQTSNVDVTTHGESLNRKITPKEAQELLKSLQEGNI